jgi:hypothetical protein
MMEVGRDKSTVKAFFDIDYISLTDGVYITQIGAVFESPLDICCRFYYVIHPGSAEADSLIGDVFNRVPPARYSLRSILLAATEIAPKGAIIAVETRELTHLLKDAFKECSISETPLILTWDDCFYEDEIDDNLERIKETRKSFLNRKK